MDCFAGGRGIENVLIAGIANEVVVNRLPDDMLIVFDVTNSCGDSVLADASEIGDVEMDLALSSSEETTGTRWITRVETKAVVVNRLSESETLVFVDISASCEHSSLVDVRDVDDSKMVLALSWAVG